MRVGGQAPKRARARAILRPGALLWVGGLLLAALVSGAVGVIVGARLEENGNGHTVRFLTRSYLALHIVHPALSTAKAMFVDGENVPLNLVEGLAAVEVDRVSIDIDHLDYETLSQKREEALKVGLLFSEAGDYVPADLTAGGESVPVELRLKGDQPDHFETDKWSFRVKVRRGGTFFGMRRFSLQHPKTRNWIGEWIFLQAHRREGLITPRYRFVEVTLNGVHKGIYALEEHFDSRLIEHAERRDGPIVKFGEELYWRARAAGYAEEEYGSFSAAAVEGYASDKSHGSEFERAVGLLEAFRRRELAASDVFDVERMATYLALRELAGSKSLPWQNLRFYYDPLTSKLEPIAFDCEPRPAGPAIDRLFAYGGGVTNKGDWYVQKPDDPVRLFFEDPLLCEAYVDALERVADPAYLDELYATVRNDLDREWSVLYREYPYYRWSDTILRENQAFLRAALDPPQALLAYHERTEADTIQLRIGNTQSLPVRILGLSRVGGEPVSPVLTDERARADILLAKRTGLPVDFLPIPFALGEDLRSADGPPPELELHYEIPGTGKRKTIPVEAWAYRIDAVLAEGGLHAPSDLDDLPFLTVDPQTGRVVIEPGVHVLDETLVLPPGPGVAAGPGVRLDLRNGARIVSHAPLELLGGEEDPVIIESSDFTGEGLLVLRASAPSLLQRVEFRNLRAPAEGGWRVPGAVTFYESPVELVDVRFSGMQAEDALHVMRTTLAMRRTAFESIQFDAFDGDFVRGELVDCGFADVGNDAVDLSGSIVRIEGLRVDGAGDKGLSAGERSEVTIHDSSIANAQLGIASKDLSEVTVLDVDLSRTRIGFAAFQKKPEFGPGRIVVEGGVFDAVERLSLIERGSTLILDGERAEAEEEALAELLYDEERDARR